MTDRELLELAAKAAGLDVRWYDGQCLRVADKCNGFAGKWAPLSNDGDALRLAVKLKIDIEFEGSPDIVWADGNWSEPAELDRLAATRLAIVRAAAEIGKGLP